jgi:hypothetical protein
VVIQVAFEPNVVGARLVVAVFDQVVALAVLFVQREGSGIAVHGERAIDTIAVWIGDLAGDQVARLGELGDAQPSDPHPNRHVGVLSSAQRLSDRFAHDRDGAPAAGEIQAHT